MIDQLTITNLGVIEHACVDFSDGMTALTGETGAGKTMTVTALQLLMGGKTDPARVRVGADKAVVEGVFVVPNSSPAIELVRDAGGEIEPVGADLSAVILARHVPADGRSRAYAGGRAVPASVLNELAQHLVTLHGQADQQRLGSAALQRSALDVFGGDRIAEVLSSYHQAWLALIAARQALSEFDQQAQVAATQRMAMQLLVKKVDAVKPQIGEDEQLKAEAQRLDNVEAVRSAMVSAANALSSDDAQGAIELIYIARHELGRANDPELNEYAARLEELNAGVSDVASNLARTLSELNADPQRLEAIHARRAHIRSLERELGLSVESMLVEADQARIQLALLDDPDAHRATLADAVTNAQNEADAIAAVLTAARHEAAENLAAMVNCELADLYMKDAYFSVELSSRDQLGPHGADSVEFLLAPHKGAAPMPLNRTASGGEMSRIMLAIEVSLARSTAEYGHTFIFDEVDAGIGGKSALAVGKRLRQLGEHTQVLCVTHLAQVAAYAGSQIVVSKTSDATGAVTDVRVVTSDEREVELARMLSGHEESHAARAHAAELLASVSMAP